MFKTAAIYRIRDTGYEIQDAGCKIPLYKTIISHLSSIILHSVSFFSILFPFLAYENGDHHHPV